MDLEVRDSPGVNGHETVVRHEPDAQGREALAWLSSELREAFAALVDTATGAIGRVVGSEREPAGSHRFCIWAADHARTLDVGHIVVAFSEEAAVIGVVDEPRRYSDLRSFLDDYFDRHLEAALAESLEHEPPTRRPEILVFTVNVLATKHVREDVTSHRPPVAGPVYFATPQAIEYALGCQNFSGTPIPALLHTNGNAERLPNGSERLDAQGRIVFQRSPILLDEDYLLGPEAGHANWTGQSGLATKTSHALFLISAIFQRLKGEGRTVAALMFNVKGPDLLWLDKPAVPEEGMEDAYAAAKFSGLSPAELEAYAALGLRPEPFHNLRIFAPFKPGFVPHDPVVHLPTVDRACLNTLRNAPAEAQCVYPILWNLSPFLWRPHKIFEREDLDDRLFGLIAEIRDMRGIETLAQLNGLFEEIEASFEEAEKAGDREGATSWRAHHKFTVRKARNRFKNLTSKFAGLLAEGEVDYGQLPRVDGPFEDQEVRIVDIAHCNTNVQELLVDAIIDRIWKLAEQGERAAKDNPGRKDKVLGVDKVIVFVDELNKYAPGGAQGGLRDTLVDIAARGRHLNVVLFGAQQFRSKVESEILGNCGTSFYGRIGDEEIISPSYRSLSDTQKAELLGLPKGRLLVRHAHFRAPLFGTFPRPPVIPGMAGQRVFNDGSAAGRADTHPGDALYHLLKRLGVKEPNLKGLVRTETDGLSAAAIERICRQVEATVSKHRGSTAASRFDPWTVARRAIADARRQGWR
jgi:hypothetical protein